MVATGIEVINLRELVHGYQGRQTVTLQHQLPSSSPSRWIKYTGLTLQGQMQESDTRVRTHVWDISGDMSKPGRRGSPREDRRAGTHSQPCSVFTQHSRGPSYFAPSRPPVVWRAIFDLEDSDTPYLLFFVVLILHETVQSEGLEKVIQGHNIPKVPSIGERDSWKSGLYHLPQALSSCPTRLTVRKGHVPITSPERPMWNQFLPFALPSAPGNGKSYPPSYIPQPFMAQRWPFTPSSLLSTPCVLYWTPGSQPDGTDLTAPHPISTANRDHRHLSATSRLSLISSRCQLQHDCHRGLSICYQPSLVSSQPQMSFSWSIVLNLII